MPTLYSVIRYCPSTISDECVNVGLLVVDGKAIRVRPLADWDRLKNFAGREWKSVRRFMSELKDEPAAILAVDASETASALDAKLCSWQRAFRFSEMRGSLESIDSLLDTLPSIFLRETAEARLDVNGRKKMFVDNIYSAVASAYAVRFDRKPTGLLKRDARAVGKRAQHKIDVGIANGTLYAGAFAISFASAQENKQWRDTDAIAFALDDIEQTDGSASLAVLLDAPAETYASRRAKSLFQDLGAELLEIGEIQSWAQRAVTKVPDSVAEHG